MLFALLTACGDDFPAECPSPSDPGVDYINETWADRDVCATVDHGCADGEVAIEIDHPECGCGCMPE